MKNGLILTAFLIAILFADNGNCVIAQNKTESQITASEILKNIKVPEFPDKVATIKQNQLKKGTWNDLINKAINKCFESGGGKVVLESGEYFCHGPLHLKSNVNLHLNEGAHLVFSQDAADYLPVVLIRWEGTEAYNYSPFIYAEYAENIAITGKGTIDGNGLAENSMRLWRDKQKDDQNLLREMGRTGVPVEKRMFGEGHFLRPQMIHFVDCKNILLEDITVTDGSFWLIQPTYCSNITIRGVKVESRYINNDGVDIDSSSDVLIENCHFNTGDDFIAIKSGRDQDGWRVNLPSKNVVVRNCTSETCLHGMSVGSEISGGVENVFVENLSFKKIRQYGLQFKSNKDRGGYIRNISVEGVKMDSVETCISFTNQYHGYNGGNSPTLFENIQIKNVVCKVASDMAVSMEGLTEMPIRNVELDNVTIEKSKNNSFIIHCKEMNWTNVNLN